MDIISIQQSKNLMKNNDKKGLNRIFIEKFIYKDYQLTLLNTIIKLDISECF